MMMISFGKWISKLLCNYWPIIAIITNYCFISAIIDIIDLIEQLLQYLLFAYLIYQ